VSSVSSLSQRHSLVQPVWYHLTERARFKLDAKFAPEDNAFALEDRSGRPGIYLGPRPETWVNEHGYMRPFLAEFRVDPSIVHDAGVHGRYGGEMFVPATSYRKLALLRVIPLDAYVREEYGAPGWIEERLGREFDTGLPLPKAVYPYRSYHYPGPDVRAMPQAEIARLKKQLSDVRRAAAREARRIAASNARRS
jgi:hypothetical protein